MNPLSVAIQAELDLLSIQEDASEIIELLRQKAEIDGDPCEKLRAIYGRASRIREQIKRFRQAL